jgi:hypothetical protein
MFKIKYFALVALAIFFGGFLSSAAAQRSMPRFPVLDPPVAEALSGSYTVQVTANELSTGDIENTSGATYGWTSYGTTDGDLSGYMFISMNYSSPLVPTGGEIDTSTSGVSTVISGSWSKLIFIDGQYTGSVYGRIVGGELVWNSRDLTATISLQLTADGGTASYVDNRGSGTFAGVLDQSAKRTTASGTLNLNY